jgi:hypothetical protein
MFRASTFHLQEALHSSFLYELRALVAFGWLQVVGGDLLLELCNAQNYTSFQETFPPFLKEEFSTLIESYAIHSNVKSQSP